MDGYGDFPMATPHRMGARAGRGRPVSRFECVGKAADTAGCRLGLDSLVARQYACARPPDFDLRTIQVRKQDSPLSRGRDRGFARHPGLRQVSAG
jgi:hypothetical protein